MEDFRDTLKIILDILQIVFPVLCGLLGWKYISASAAQKAVSRAIYEWSFKSGVKPEQVEALMAEIDKALDGCTSSARSVAVRSLQEAQPKSLPRSMPFSPSVLSEDWRGVKWEKLTEPVKKRRSGQ